MAASPFSDLFPGGPQQAESVSFADLFGPAPSVRVGQYDVLDGDTIDVLDGEGKASERVRLWGVDSSELGRESAAQARQAVVEALGSGEYTLQRKGTDAHGRTLGVLVGKDGTELNRELVRRGLARGEEPYAAESRTANDAFLAGELDPEVQAVAENPSPYRPPMPETRPHYGDTYAGIKQGTNQLQAAGGGVISIFGSLPKLSLVICLKHHTVFL